MDRSVGPVDAKIGKYNIYFDIRRINLGVKTIHPGSQSVYLLHNHLLSFNHQIELALTIFRKEHQCDA
ncbi:hypothetical protein GeomeDRAFT_3327 [Geobacter metallireducens RCH3]|nr:hypothetical protein [Geobacter metallireducens]EHP83998.1 hypothetical protein GeomeDRAFT_3327 [Geobacter metallireducens RCH3]